MFREGLRVLLDRTGEAEVVGEAADGQEAVEKASELHPDLVIMDIGMPRLNGLEATRQLRHQCPQTKVLILTVYATDEHFFQALEAGASGYILKEGASTDLRYAMSVVQSGGVFIYPSLSRRLVEDYLERAKTGEEHSDFEKLTKREREILQLIAEGCTNREIAERLLIAVSTVQTHRGHVMEKLGLHSRAQLLGYALRAGLLQHAASSDQPHR
ncbi:MAG: response regulator transcription factor [Chloroflexi bacterium]|nr:response regulator transcription factor [Chloroflexota bacterium]